MRRLEQLGQQGELVGSLTSSATGWLSSLADSDASTGARAREAVRQSAAWASPAVRSAATEPRERGGVVGGWRGRRARQWTGSPTGSPTGRSSASRCSAWCARTGASRGGEGRRAAITASYSRSRPRSRSAAAPRRASSGSTGAGRGAGASALQAAASSSTGPPASTARRVGPGGAAVGRRTPSNVVARAARLGGRRSTRSATSSPTAPTTADRQVDPVTATPRVLALLEPVVSSAGYDLEDLTVSAAGKRSVVRVLVDKDGGITLDDVADVSRLVSEALDAADEQDPSLLGTSYVLEVSSPGVDRPLTEPRHWRRNVGRLVAASLRDGVAAEGRITAVDDAGVVLDEQRVLPWADRRTGRRPGGVQPRTTTTRRTTREDRHGRAEEPGAREGDLLRHGRRGHRDGAAHRLPPHRGRQPHARIELDRTSGEVAVLAQELAEDGELLGSTTTPPRASAASRPAPPSRSSCSGCARPSAPSPTASTPAARATSSPPWSPGPARPGAPPTQRHVLIGSGTRARGRPAALRAGAGRGVRPRHPPEVQGRRQRARPARAT